MKCCELFDTTQIISEATEKYNDLFSLLAEKNGYFKTDIKYPDLISLDDSFEELRDYLAFIKFLNHKYNLGKEKLIDGISIFLNQINELKIRMMASENSTFSKN